MQVQFAQRDLAGNKLRKYFRSFHLPQSFPASQLKVDASFPIELQNVALHSVSPSGLLLLTIMLLRCYALVPAILLTLSFLPFSAALRR